MRKVFIFGMARSGYEAAKLLLNNNIEAHIFDAKEQDKKMVDEIESLGGSVTICDNPEDYLDSSFDLVVKNPGIKKDHVCLEKARSLNIDIINEVELAFNYLPKCTIIGVTGSNGKTTTTTLIYEILKENFNVHLGGNIGVPLSNIVNDVKENDIVVLEVSDHQLCDMYKFKTNISVFTNVSPTHLDFHDSYDTYKAMKMRIFNHHTNKDIAILNLDNEEEINLTKNIPSIKYYFSKDKNTDAYIENGKIIIKDYLDIDTKEILVKGMHNYENIMAALLVAKILNADCDVARDVIKNFKGVEHRIEFVCEKDGVFIYNDSKSTNNVATQTALKSFDAPIHLLMGGLDRGQDYNELIPYMRNVKKIYVFGEVKEKIKEFADMNNIECFVYNNLKEATLDALNSALKGEVILLSPAHASWDQYACFEDRGNEFKSIVKEK